MRLTLWLLLASILPSHVFATDIITTFVVQEALRADEAGINRTSETVTVGLPLPEDGGFKNTSIFGLTGSEAGQFKITGWWPNGNAKWVTIDLQTNLQAREIKSGFSLTNSGTGNFGGANLATDTGEGITVDTGVATFTIKKANFNLFDAVTVGGTSLVSSGHTGGFRIVDTSSTVYSSLNDPDSNAVIEDNGPVKAVVVSSGTLADAGNKRFCDYEVRLTFFKGKSYVKGIVSLRNAKYEDYVASITNNKEFYSSELSIPLTIGSTKIALLTDAKSEYTRPLAPNETAYVYQGHSSHPLKIPLETQGGADGWEPPIPKSGTNPWVFDPTFMGVNLVIGSETLQSLGQENTWTQGYADLSDDTGKGLTVALKYMPQNYPAGFDIKGSGEVSIELFSKRNNNTICKLGWSKWESKEIIWDFHDLPNVKTVAFHALQHTLIARAPFEYYRANKAFGTDELVTIEEEIQYYDDVGETAVDLSDPIPTTSVASYPWRGYFRTWARAVGGVSNTIDTPASDLLDWVRSGKAGYYVFASQRLFFDSYAGPRRSDDFKFESNDSGAEYKNGHNISGGSFDMEHHFIQGLPWLYFLTGNSFYKNAATEDAEWEHRMFTFAVPSSTIPGTPYFRWWSRQAQPLAIYYDFSNTIHKVENTYANDLTVSFNYLINSREDTANIPLAGEEFRGRNMERGYIYWDSTVSMEGRRVIWSFFHTQIHFNAAYESWKFLKKWGYDYPEIEDLEDYLTGLSQFIYKEYIKCEDVIWGGKCGFEYGYQPYSTRTEVLSNGGNEDWKAIKPMTAARAYVWLHKKTGDNYQNQADMAATWYDKNKRQASSLQEQALTFQHIHNAIIPDRYITPQITTDGSGSYTLAWIVPEGIQSYQIKYAYKNIADWLGYDRDSQTYQYDPSTNIAFFAAQNVTNEPVPLEPGETQQYTINGLNPEESAFFVIKGSAYSSSNPVKANPLTIFNIYKN